MPKVIVTTGLRSGPDRRALAAGLSRELECPFILRDGRSLAQLQGESGAEAVVVVGGRRVSLFYAGRELFFHPGMAKLRIKELRAGKTDQMVKAMDLRPGHRVLDCTLGLAADALVASYVVGPRGLVLGLEASRPLAVIVRHGLATYGGKREAPDLLAAMRRIGVAHADHREFLARTPAGAYDVVYFDPMFRHPVYRSSAMEPLRPLAETAPLDTAAITEAKRVAARRVVVKERRDGPEFARLGLTRVESGRYSPVAFGILERGRDY
ncbi:MAG: class I SAM-dependent methyltransferase [Thermoanaerobacterales bacterium]|nr:class I SAM-dependent methyltransferase [Thermoanaerobacterales bacterium]